MNSVIETKLEHIEERLEKIEDSLSEHSKYLRNQSWRLYSLTAGIALVCGTIGTSIRDVLRNIL